MRAPRPTARGWAASSVSPLRIGDGGVQADLGLRGPDLDQLTGADLPGGHRVEVRVEGDQAVLADVPQMPLGDHIGDLRQRPQGRVVPRGPEPDDLAVGAVDLRPPQRHPGRERGVHLLDRGEGPPGQDVVADDAATCRSTRPLPWDGRRPARRCRSRSARRRRPPPDAAEPPRPGRRAGAPRSWSGRRRCSSGTPPKCANAAPVAVEERRQVLAGGEAAERVARVRQRHVEGVDLRDARHGRGSCPRRPSRPGPGHPGTTSNRRCRPASSPGLMPSSSAIRGPGLLQIELDPLVVDGEPVLLDQALVDHRALEQDLRPAASRRSAARPRPPPAAAAEHPTPSSAARPEPSPTGTSPTVRRFSPVSFAISRRLIAPDSYSGRNRLNSNQRCGSKTTVSRLPATPNRQQQTHGPPPITASETVHVHPYEVVHVRLYADTRPLTEDLRRPWETTRPAAPAHPRTCPPRVPPPPREDHPPRSRAPTHPTRPRTPTRLTKPQASTTI